MKNIVFTPKNLFGGRCVLGCFYPDDTRILVHGGLVSIQTVPCLGFFQDGDGIDFVTEDDVFRKQAIQFCENLAEQEIPHVLWLDVMEGDTHATLMASVLPEHGHQAVDLFPHEVSNDDF